MKNQIKVTAIELHREFNKNYHRFLTTGRRTEKRRMKIVEELKALNIQRVKEGIPVLSLTNLERG